MQPPDSHPAPDDRIAVGIIRKPHGVRGELSVEPWSSSPQRFEELDSVWLVSPDGSSIRNVAIESVRDHGQRALVKFSGIDSPEEGSLFREWTVEIAEADARELEEDEYFLHDLIGLSVVREGSGEKVGTVRNTLEGGGGVLLEVTRVGGGTFDLPFASAICKKIDLAERTLIVDLPEGLEDLDKVQVGEIENSEFRIQKEGGRRPDSSLDARNDTAANDDRAGGNSELTTQNSELPLPQPVPEPGTHNPEPPTRIDIVTIFPRMFDAFLAEGVIARGLKAGVLAIHVHDLRDFTTDKHRSTDDEAYGGGVGMVMLAEPVFRCIDFIRDSEAGQAPHVVMLSPQGSRFDHGKAAALAAKKWLVLLCGRYEGFDERIREAAVDEEISVGDFVVSGGEIPAMLVADAVGRMVEGVVGDRNSVEADSFYNGLLDHPHYTRPAELRGMKVPEVLLSGHAEKIRRWRKEQSLRATKAKRPELLEKADLDEESREILRKITREEE